MSALAPNFCASILLLTAASVPLCSVPTITGTLELTLTITLLRISTLSESVNLYNSLAKPKITRP